MDTTSRRISCVSIFSTVFLCLGLVGCSHNLSSPDHGTNMEAQLISDIFHNYNPKARPVSSHFRSVNVTISLMMYHILKLDTVEQTLHWVAWVAIEWNDEYLKWSTDKYDNIDEIHIPVSDIWVPEIYMLNSVSENFDVTSVFAPTNAFLGADGHLKWVTTSYFITTCEIDVKQFPFDTQVCPVRIGTRTYSEEFITLSVGKQIPVIDKKTYSQNGEWDLLRASSVSQTTDVPYSDEEFYEVVYSLILKRRPMFYLYNLLLPGLLVLVIGSLVFLIPPQSGEKISLSITALLTMMVFLLIIMDFIPETSQSIPLIGRLFGAATVMLSLSTILAVWVSNIHYSGDRGNTPPKCLVALVRSPLAVLCCMGSSRKLMKKSEKYTMMNLEESDSSSGENQNTTNVERLLGAILKEVKSKLKEERFLSEVETQWHIIAMFVDRLLYFLFVCVIVALVVLIFFFID